ncbi:MAG: hypothetical protein PVH77_00160 [Phycisphaerales bacterium]|jgi:hypothetical protein
MKVLVECDADEAVLRALGVTKKQLLHFGGKGNVINRLKKLPGATGIVDEDPASAQPRDLNNYQEEVQTTEGLRLLTRQGKGGQRLILVCPKLEDWLIQRAESSGIQPDDYGLPSNPDKLHSIPRYEQKEGFSRFLAELKERDSGIHLLRRWILRA